MDFRELLAKHFAEDLTEPKRPEQTIHQMGIEMGGGLKNILKVLAAATPAEKEFWAKWYHVAGKEVAALARKYRMNFDRVAAAVAALSPGALWKVNMQSADRICKLVYHHPGATVEQLMNLLRPGSAVELGSRNYIQAGDAQVDSRLVQMNYEAKAIDAEEAEGVASYLDNIRKALRVLLTGDTSHIQTRKVWVFYKGLIDPDGVKKEIEKGTIDEKTRTMLNRKTTVDGHAINVWRGFKRPLNDIKSVPDELFDRIEKDYQEAARLTGLSTRAVQAITWYVWKFTKDPEPPPQLTTIAKTPQGEQPHTQELNPHQFRKTLKLIKAGTLPNVHSLMAPHRGPDGEWLWTDVSKPVEKKKAEEPLYDYDELVAMQKIGKKK